MRIITEKELYRLWKEDKEKALETLKNIDYVMDDRAWFIPTKFYIEKLSSEAKKVV